MHAAETEKFLAISILSLLIIFRNARINNNAVFLAVSKSGILKLFDTFQC